MKEEYKRRRKNRIEENSKLIGIACANLAIKVLIENKVPITPMIIGYEMFAIFDEFSDKEIWKRADQII